MGLVRSRFRRIAAAGALLMLLMLLAIPAVASAHSANSAALANSVVVSDSSAASSNSQTVVKVGDQISALINTVNGFHLNPLVQQLLDSPLQAALNALNTSTGGTKAACSDMASFTRQVGLQAGKGLTVQQAKQLFTAAVSIEKALGC